MLYSINFKRYLDSNEVRISVEKGNALFVFCKVVEVPEDSQLNDILEDQFIFTENQEQTQIGKDYLFINFFRLEILRIKFFY